MVALKAGDVDGAVRIANERWRLLTRCGWPRPRRPIISEDNRVAADRTEGEFRPNASLRPTPLTSRC